MLILPMKTFSQIELKLLVLIRFRLFCDLTE
ncbi:hypothetical protein AT5A_16221 [Agrobacterium tumefaciens 5A]|nr:hypothetical protein AT5A_16221 [Agrobacterium tumefaciens 5A]